MLLRFIPKCNTELDDFKENAETCKKGKNGPVRCNVTGCVGISPSFGKGTEQSKHGLYGHVTPNFTARENQRNSAEEEAGAAFS